MSHVQNEVLVGSTRGIRAYFHDANNEPVDPADVAAWVTKPDGTTESLVAAVDTEQLDDDVAGAVYYVATDLIDAAGVWKFYMKGDDTADDVAKIEYRATASNEPTP